MGPHAGWNSRGYVPHYDAADVTQHIVFRLAGSLPASFAAQARALPPAKRFALAESLLDLGVGASALADPAVARMVEAALLFFDPERYRLRAWCVMPNHVHALAEPIAGFALARIVHGWKSFTAHRANAMTAATGPFWAADYFDRAIRDREDGESVVGYIENNPVKAGLCAAPADWPWSSARRR